MQFGTIIADPPWAYGSAQNNDRRQRGYVTYRDGTAQYPTLDTGQLCNLPVDKIAAPDAVLLLWTTGPFIPDALDVIDFWGFTYKTVTTWGKVTKAGQVNRGGVGYWFRGASEYVLVGSRGKSYRTGEPGLYLSEKLPHSSKPDWMHEVAERHFPGPYLELFGRRERPGWRVLGDEAPGDGMDIRDSIAKLVAREG